MSSPMSSAVCAQPEITLRKGATCKRHSIIRQRAKRIDRSVRRRAGCRIAVRNETEGGLQLSGTARPGFQLAVNPHAQRSRPQGLTHRQSLANCPLSLRGDLISGEPDTGLGAENLHLHLRERFLQSLVVFGRRIWVLLQLIDLSRKVIQESISRMRIKAHSYTYKQEHQTEANSVSLRRSPNMRARRLQFYSNLSGLDYNGNIIRADLSEELQDRDSDSTIAPMRSQGDPSPPLSGRAKAIKSHAPPQFGLMRIRRCQVLLQVSADLVRHPCSAGDQADVESGSDTGGSFAACVPGATPFKAVVALFAS
jgi:hypothetical protein